MLLLIILIVVAALFILFWGLTVFLQGYLYSEPAAHIPVRAVIAAAVVGGVIGAWTYANAKSDKKGKYGPLHDFDSTGMTDVYEFTAVRKYPGVKGADGQPKEEKATFKRAEGQKSATFVEEKTGKPFQLNTSEFVTTAFELKEADGKVGKFEAVFAQKDVYAAGKPFTEPGTKRHVDGDVPGTIFAPSTKAKIYAIALNVLNYLAWFLALWLAMRFAWPHALGLAAIFGLLTMLVVGPLLFERVRPKDTPTRKLQVTEVPVVPTVPGGGQANEGEPK